MEKSSNGWGGRGGGGVGGGRAVLNSESGRVSPRGKYRKKSFVSLYIILYISKSREKVAPGYVSLTRILIRVG